MSRLQATVRPPSTTSMRLISLSSIIKVAPNKDNDTIVFFLSPYLPFLPLQSTSWAS